MFDRILLRPAEAAVSLGVGRAKIYDLIHRGEIPSIRLGGAIRVPADRLKALIDERTTGHTPDAAPTVAA